MSTTICTETLTDEPLVLINQAGEGEATGVSISIEGTGVMDTSSDGIGDLLRSARKTFQTIEPWCQVTTTFQNETLASVVAGFHQCTGLFCDAIDKSVEVSYTGVGLAQDANKLLDSISYNASSEHIEPFLDNMIQLTLDAHNRSQDVLEGFRAARRGLNEVTGQMAFNVRDIQHDIKLAQNSKLRYRTAASVAAGAGGVARQGQAFFSGGDPLSAVASTSVPCLGIILPIVLGLAALAADSLEERWTRRAEQRGSEQLSAEEALSRLKKINDDISGLLEEVRVFADWWHGILGSLQWIKANINRIRHPQNAYILDRLREKWGSVGQQYIDYSREISKLQDYYPDIPRSGAEILAITYDVPASDEAAAVTAVGLVSTIQSLARNIHEAQGHLRRIHDASMAVKPRHFAQFHEDLNAIKVHFSSECNEATPYLELIVSFGDNMGSSPLPSTGQAYEEFQDRVWSIALKAVETIRAVLVANVASLDALKSRKQSLQKALPTERAEREKSIRTQDPERGCANQSTRASLHILEQLLLEIGSTSKTLSNFWLDRRVAFEAFTILFEEEKLNGQDAGDRGMPLWWSHRQSITSAMELISQAHDSVAAMCPASAKGSIDNFKHNIRRSHFGFRRFTTA